MCWRRSMRKTDRFIRSLLFSTLVVIYTVPFCALCILIWPLSVEYRFHNIKRWTNSVIWLLRVICHVDYHVEGIENIPTDRVGVVVCKHQSAWETFFVPRFFKSATVIVKKELFWVPFFGWGLWSTDPIAINRRAQKSAMQQIIDKGKKCLQRGRWVIVFPEGTRTLPGKIGNYRPGAARLAVAAECPILPIAHNAGHFWRKRGFLKRPGVVQVAIGPLIETKGRRPEEVMEEAKQWIENAVSEMEKKYHAHQNLQVKNA